MIVGTLLIGSLFTVGCQSTLFQEEVHCEHCKSLIYFEREGNSYSLDVRDLVLNQGAYTDEQTQYLREEAEKYNGCFDCTIKHNWEELVDLGLDVDPQEALLRELVHEQFCDIKQHQNINPSDYIETINPITECSKCHSTNLYRQEYDYTCLSCSNTMNCFEEEE